MNANVRLEFVSLRNINPVHENDIPAETTSEQEAKSAEQEAAKELPLAAERPVTPDSKVEHDYSALMQRQQRAIRHLEEEVARLRGALKLQEDDVAEC